jgi:hypothetical protein
MSKYQVIIAQNEEVLFDCTEGDTSGGVSFFADSLEEAERILNEHTAVPGKGGVINVPDSDEPSLIVLPMRTRDDIGAAEEEFDDKVWYDRHQMRKTQLGEDAARRIEDKYGQKVMIELGWTAVRVRDLTCGGYKEQVRGWCRDAPSQQSSQ